MLLDRGRATPAGTEIDPCSAVGLRRPSPIAVRVLVVLVASVIVLGLGAGAARADTTVGKPIQLTTNGDDPDVAVDDSGMAHVVWTRVNVAPSSDTLMYCQIPRGSASCQNNQSFTPPLPADGSGAEGRPRVLLPGNDHIILLTHRVGLVDFNAVTGAVDPGCASDGGCVAEDHLTWAYESFDDGQTWQPPLLIGVVPTEGGAIAFDPTPPFSLENAGSTPPNNAPVTTDTPLIGGVSAGFETGDYNLGFQAAPLDGSTTFDVADLGAGQTGFSDASAVGLTPADQPLVLGHFGDGLIWSRYNGGPLDDVVSTGGTADWSGGQFSSGGYPTLASGAGGLFALTSSNNQSDHSSFVVSKYNGAPTGVPFDPGVSVATDVEGDSGSDLDEDTLGSLYGVVVAHASSGSEELHLLQSSGGTSWSTTTLASTETNAIQRPTVSSASDGGGVAVYQSSQSDESTLTAVPFGTTEAASAQVDVRVNAMEITQGVQTFELPTRNPAHPLDNDVNYHGVTVPGPVSAEAKGPQIVKMVDDGHPTVIRVYANTRAPLFKGVVPAMTLTAFRNGREIYPDPILPDVNYANGGTKSQPSDLPVGNVGQVPANAQETPGAAYTFTLPASWTSGDVTFQAQINPPGLTPSIRQCPRCGQYTTLRLGPIHFTKIDEVAVQPVALDGHRADNGQPVYPLGGLDPDPPYTAQPRGLADNGPPYTLAAGLSGQTVTPPPFAGMRAVTPFSFHVNPYFDIVDAGSILNDTKESYGDRTSDLADIVTDWADGRFNCNCWYVPGIYSTNTAADTSGGVTLDAPGKRVLYAEPGHSLFGGYRTAVAVWSDDRPVNASAHELGHTIDRLHAGLDCGSNSNGQHGEIWPPQNNGNDGEFDGVGLDFTSPSPYRILSWNETSAPTDSSLPTGTPVPPFYDLMSYCGSSLGNDDHWVSVANWNRAVLFGAAHLGRSAARAVPSSLSFARTARSSLSFARAASPPQSLSVTVNENLLTSQAQVSDVHPATGAPIPANATSMYTLRGLNAAGQVIATDAATGAPDSVERNPRDPQVQPIFNIAGSIPASARGVQVLVNGQVIATRTASAHAPTVRVTAPRGGQRVGGHGNTVIRWIAGDADHDVLTASVAYSANAGATWVSIYQGPAAAGQATLPSRLLARSDRARVRVSVSDGWNQAKATSAVFRSLGAPPTVMITAPTMHARVPAGGNLNLAATAYDDREMSLPAKAIHWTAGRFTVGTGKNLTADDLPAGHYRLTAIATDRFGRKGSMSVPIVVLPAKPLLRIFKAPKAISRRARTVKLRVAAVTPAVLAVGRHQFLVTRTPMAATVPVTPGRKRLTLHVVLRSGGYRAKLTVTLKRH